MPVIVEKNGQSYYLVPAPTVNFSRQNINKVDGTTIGLAYTCSLNGTLLPNIGNPYYDASGNAGLSQDSWTSTYTNTDDPSYAISGEDWLDAIIKKQEIIRSLFTSDKPIKVTIKGFDTANDGPGLVFMANVESISFGEENRWAGPTTYSVELSNIKFLSSAAGQFAGFDDLSQKYYISDVSENFSIQEEGSTVVTFDTGFQIQSIDKIYTISRSVSAIGQPIYDSSGNYVSGLAPYQHASGYVHEVMGLGTGVLPKIKAQVASLLGSGYNVANFQYSEEVNELDGSYSVSENYIAYKGDYPVIEEISINIDYEESMAAKASVQGNIRGLNTIDGFSTQNNAYQNADSYLQTLITGVPPKPYYYIKHAYSGWIHPLPVSKSISRAIKEGTISYSFSFDSRPPNIIPGSIIETVTINDTYPGEIINQVNVIGRSQPILQYLGSRSGYKRTLNINVVMAYDDSWWGHDIGVDIDGSGHYLSTGVAYSDIQNILFNKKPSVTNKAELDLIYQAANPVNDPTISVVPGKCFHGEPQESWDYKTRTYTYSVEWTYEREE